MKILGGECHPQTSFLSPYTILETRLCQFGKVYVSLFSLGSFTLYSLGITMQSWARTSLRHQRTLVAASLVLKKEYSWGQGHEKRNTWTTMILPSCFFFIANTNKYMQNQITYVICYILKFICRCIHAWINTRALLLHVVQNTCMYIWTNKMFVYKLKYGCFWNIMTILTSCLNGS
jgi:hypothetical protein